MSAPRQWLVAAALVTFPALLAAQEGGVEARLAARGVPSGLARDVAAVAVEAASRGVPSGPLADKAIEGWAKQVPPARILAAVRLFADRMADARVAVRSAGIETPPGEVVAAAAQAMGAGIGAANVVSLMRAAPASGSAAPALTVAAALAAQGLGGDQAVAVVVEALHNHQSMSEVLNLPSVAGAMRAQGMTPGEIGRRMMEGGGAPGGMRPGAPQGARPPGVPPGMGSGGRPQRPPGHP